MPGGLEAAALETISVKLHDENYIASGADTSDPHLRTRQLYGETDLVSEMGADMSVVCRRFLRLSHPR